MCLPVLRPVDPEVGRVEEGGAEGGVGQADDGAGQPEEQEARAHQPHRARHLGVAGGDLLADLVAATADMYVWELPDMMSASEGGAGSWKSGRSKGGCMNFLV